MRFVEAAGLRMSAVGLGTGQFGAVEWGYGQDYADHTAVEIVERALDLGVTLIDTAERYGFGRSEQIVGRALASSDHPAFVATKLTPVLPIERVVVRQGIRSAVRLGRRPIDLYQLHGPNPVVPISSTMAGMRRLRDEGVIAHVGVSNLSADRWHEAERALGAPVVSNQVSYSLVDRRCEADVLAYAQACDRVVIAYSPLGQGLLGGRYDVDHRPAGLARRTNPLFLRENLEAVRPLLDALRAVADDVGARCSQVALAWLLRRPNVVVIPGVSSVEQLEANVAAAHLELTEDHDARLAEASEAVTLAGTGPVVVDRVRRRVEGS